MADNRTRAERRADPERWFQCVEMGDGENVIDVEGNQLLVKGKVEDILVVAIPRESMEGADRIAVAVSQALIDSGEARDVIVIPQDVKLMKLRPLSRERSKQLDVAKSRKEMHERVKRNKEIH